MKSFALIVLATIFCLSNANSPKECYEEGLFCETCSSLVHCTRNADDTWTKTSKQSCPWGQKCLQGACTKDPEPICDGIADMSFVCTTVGIFPHPFYCNKYVMCVDDWGLRPFVAECEPGYGYDVATAQCDLELQGQQCRELDYPVPQCTGLLQSNSLPGNPSIFYRCQEVNRDLFTKVLFPVLYECPHGLVYEQERDQCA